MNLLDLPAKSTVMHFLSPVIYRLHSNCTQACTAVVFGAESYITVIDLELRERELYIENLVFMTGRIIVLAPSLVRPLTFTL